MFRASWSQVTRSELNQSPHKLPSVLEKRQSTCSSGSHTTTNGDVFTVVCGVDYPFNDLSSNPQLNITNCMEQCSLSHPLCVAVAFEPTAAHGPNNCYLKSGRGEAVTQTFSMDAAYSVPTAAAETCVNENATYVSSTGGNAVFELKCGRDYPGNDIQGAQFHARSISACMDICAGYAGCVGVAYQASLLNGFANCYLKNAIGVPLIQTFVIDGAVVVATKTQSSVSSSATTASTTAILSSSTTSSSSSAAVPTATPSGGAAQSDSGNDNGVKIGVGVGVSLGVVLIALLIAFLVFRRRKSKSRDRTEPRYEIQGGGVSSLGRGEMPAQMVEERGELDGQRKVERRGELDGQQQKMVHELPGP